MRLKRFLGAGLAGLTLLLMSCAQMQTTERTDGSTLAFGSCLRQWQDQPVWRSVNALAPEAFVFLGDNVYSDVGGYVEHPEPERIELAYRHLADSPQFEEFLTKSRRQGTKLYATWDDHDYGVNDGGADYPHRLASKRYFLDFFGLKKTAVGVNDEPGIYQSHRLKLSGLDVQLILLDTRSFRSPLKKDPDSRTCPQTSTVANTDPGATVLGERQWQWLEGQLNQPADLRILASSIQVIPHQHCFEKWANFPRERERLFNLIRATKAEGVILLSGDRHLAEISQLPGSVAGYPLYEITSSGLNSAMGPTAMLAPEKNPLRIDRNFVGDNFGSLRVVEHDDGHSLALRIHNTAGGVAREVRIPLERLTFD